MENSDTVESVRRSPDTETDTETSDADTGEMEREEWAQSQKIREAVKNNDLEVVNNILDDNVGLVLSDRTMSDETLLHTAAKEGHDSIVDLLIRKGANVNAKTEFKETPLHLAITKAISIANVIYLLISNGTDINAGDSLDITPLDGIKNLKTIMTYVEPYVRRQNKRPSGDAPPSKRQRTSLRF